jgi:hypothetical protein
LYQTGTGKGDNLLYQWLSNVSFAPLLVLSISACEASQMDVGGANAGQQAAGNAQAPTSNRGKNVTNEQVPINQRFSNLDEYLAHLERTQGPVDGPWYKEVRPGIYELQTGNLHLDSPGAEKRTFTRAELERKFGFSD